MDSQLTSVRKFAIDKKILSQLRADERKLLPILIKAVKKIDPIFLLQENARFDGANFYPHDATVNEIERAASENPSILLPFTVVKRDKEGKLFAVPYHEEYQKLLTQPAKLLAMAAKISKNPSFSKYLKALSNSLLEGTYEDAVIAWFEVKNSNIDVTLAPYERYLDKLYFVKRAYQGSVGIIDKDKTEKTKILRDILYTTIGPKPHRVITPSIVDIKVESTPVLSGIIGRLLFSHQHLPSDSDLMEKYGSRILGYLSSMDYKFEKILYPIFQAVFEKNFRARYTKEQLRQGNYYHVLLRGVAQQLHRYINSRTRLRSLFPIYDEANTMASGIQHAKHLVLKGLLDQKQLESMMIAQICWMFGEWVFAKKSKAREVYLKGDALTLNFLVMQGALQEKEGISWPNFAKIFFEMENLATIFTRFLEEGSYLEAQQFLAKYLSYEPFKAFEKSLKNIKPL